MTSELLHMEFHKLDMSDRWHSPEGYPAGIQQKILAGELNEVAETGRRTRLLRFEPGVYTTQPFVHRYWEEVFLISGDLVVGVDGAGKGAEKVHRLHLCDKAARRISRTVSLRYRLPPRRNALFRLR